MLAKVATALDFVSDGRLILGLGCGWHEPEYQAFGYPFDHRVSRFEEIVSAVRALLHGERVSVAGRWIDLDDAVILPAPVRQIPIVIASEGPRMMAITARLADGWQCGWSGLPDDDYRREVGALRASCDAEGRTEPIEILKGIDVTDATDEPDAHLPLDAAAIADGLAAWHAEGVDHVQLRVHRATQASFDVALAGIRRFKGE